jgi:hypothetical protein
MTRRTAVELMLAAPLVFGQDAKVAPSTALPVTTPDPEDYVCPMDPDVRSSKPGVCPRCGMKLTLGVPEAVEYPVRLELNPRVLRAGEKVEITFHITAPKTGAPVVQFEIVHERLFHMFIVSQDLEYFIHDHPVFGADRIFRYEATFPKPGMYRILSDFYPSGATPQLIERTLIVPAAPGQDVALQPATLTAELGPSHCANMDVELVTDPAQPICGMKTMLFFKFKPAEGMEKYLGAWGHMLAASDDLIDMIHTHPFIADGGPQAQFNVIFPRERMYRVWVQFQRKGVVNTAVFNIPVTELR